MYFSPLIPPLLIRMILFMICPNWSTDWDPLTYSGTAAPLLLLSLISGYFIWSQTQLLMGQMIVKWRGAEGPAAEDHIPVPQGRRVPLFNMCHRHRQPCTHPGTWEFTWTINWTGPITLQQPTRKVRADSNCVQYIYIYIHTCIIWVWIWH